MTFKLIIFDLDDTLIDTSGSLGPRKLFDALQVMVDAGLPVKSMGEGLKQLKAIDENSLSGKETIIRFVKEMDAPAHLAEAGIKEYYEHIEGDFTIHEVEGAQLVLQVLAEKSTLVVVSWGLEAQQLQKMKKAGFDAALFAKTIFIPENNKKPVYQQLLLEYSLEPSDVLVCGDRFSWDLLPAQELGMKTVHFRWGRGKKAIVKADYSIGKLQELLEIVK